MTQPPPPPYQAQPLSPSDERLWGTLIHVSGIVIGFIGPLLGYLLLKDRSAFVGENSKNALNFQITVAIAYVAVAVISVITFGIGALLYFPVWIVSVIFCVLGAVAANRGEVYKYPLTITFIR